MSHVCEWCKTKFKANRNNKGRFCSLDCFHKNRFMENFLSWYYQPVKEIHPETLKEYLMTMTGHVCQVYVKQPNECCTKPELMHDVPLVLDHVDGDAHNNHYSNIRLLCASCHSLTPNYKNKNQLGRYKRKMEIIL